MKFLLTPALLFSVLLFSCTSNKKTTKLTFNNGDLLYTDSITEAQAKNLGNYLITCGFFDGKQKTVQVDKQNGTIHFAMILIDSFAFSDDYHTIALSFIGELEKNVFPSNSVEVDFCDAHLKVKKNIKGAGPIATIPTENSLQGAWICENISGGEATDPHQQASELEVIKTNFTFSFNGDQTFQSDFLNPNDVSQPLNVKGRYSIKNSRIALHHLTINDVPAEEEMLFELVEKNNSFQLISHTEGVEDLVMTFKKAG